MRRSKKIIISDRGEGGVGIRRIFRIGGSSVVCLPHEFLFSKGLKVGDELIVSWNGGLKFSPLKEGSEVQHDEG